MPIAIQDIARQVVANTGLEGGFAMAAQWVGQRYTELCARAKFRHLRKIGQLYLPAPITTGACTITLDSPLVILDSVASAFCATLNGTPFGLVGQWFRVFQAAVWYRISEVDSTNPGAWTLTLETPYAMDNQSAGFFSQSNTLSNLSFYIIPKFVDIAPDARQIGTMVLDGMYRVIRQLSEDQLNMMFPNRLEIAYPPRYWAEVGTDLDTTDMPKVVEFYPYPFSSATIHYTYWATPPTLGWADYIPPTIDTDVLRTGAMIDACRNRAGKERRLGNLEAARDWNNDAMRYETIFEHKTYRAIRNDRGVDDARFILANIRGSNRVAQDYDPVQDAYENFLARGI